MPKGVPSYGHHKPSGQARVILNGKHIYLGPYGSPESREAYARLIAESCNSSKNSDGKVAFSRDSLTIDGLLLSYWRFAEEYYQQDGKPTKELACNKEAILPLRELYGSTVAEAFGPKSLKAVRQHMISCGLCRTLINRRIGRIKRIFKWAVLVVHRLNRRRFPCFCSTKTQAERDR